MNDTLDALDRLMRRAPVPGASRVVHRGGRDDRLEATSHTGAEVVPWTMADDDTVRAVIEDHLFETDGPVWDQLTGDAATAVVTERVLGAFKIELQQQFTTRRADAEAYQQQCLAGGPDGKTDWFAYKADWEDWRRRAGFVDQRVAKLLGFVRERRKELNRADTDQQLRTAWRALAKAIRDHRDSTAPDRDQRLYDALHQTTVFGDSVAHHMSFWTW